MEEDRNSDVTRESSDTLTSETVRNDFSSDNYQSDQTTSSSSSLPLHYIDLPLNIPTGTKTGGYVSFSVRKTFDLTELVASTIGDNDDEEKQTKIIAAKKLIFPSPIAPSFVESAETLRKERRDEFSPIYPNETAEEVARRQSKRKSTQNLLTKRIRFDDLKRKREENETRQRLAQQNFQYGPYGSINYGNPYESMQYQNEQMAEIARVQREHSGFWPELQQQQQTFSAYPPTYSTNTNENSSWFYSNAMNAQPRPPPPPPPPPSEPYPY